MKSFDFFQITVIIYLIPIKQNSLYELIVHIPSSLSTDFYITTS